MTDDLVKRLRRTYRKEYAPTRSMCGDNSNKPFPFPILATEVLFNPDGIAAADRIEAQAAEIERLRDALFNAVALIGHSVPMDTTALVAGGLLTANGVWHQGRAALAGDSHDQ